MAGFDLPNMQPETFAQANPFFTGWAAAQQIQDQGYKNQIDAATAKYADPTAAAALAYSQAQTPYLNAQTQGIYQGQIPKDQADANLANAQAKFAGIMAIANYLKGAGYYNRNSPAMLGLNASNTSTGQSLVASNPTAANNATNDASNVISGAGFVGLPSSSNGGQGPVYNVPTKTSSGVTQGGSVNLPTITPSDQWPSSAYMQNAGNNGNPGIPSQNQQSQTPQQKTLSAMLQTAFGPAFMGAAPNATSNQPMMPIQQQLLPQNLPQNYPQNSNVLNPDAAALQNYIKNKMANTNLTKGQQQQVVYDNSLQNTLQPLLNDLPSVVTYSGASGHAQLIKDKVNAAFGRPVSANYQNYLDYMKVAPVIANELRRAYGGQATDSENKMLEELVDPISWYAQPAQALKQFQTLMNAVHQNTQAITQSKVTNLNQATNSPALQVPQAAQNASAMIPAFPNKAAFQSWYSSLSPDKQAAVSAQLKGAA
jgi:hypothetical protein